VEHKEIKINDMKIFGGAFRLLVELQLQQHRLTQLRLMPAFRKLPTQVDCGQ
jgi:hypothetical protein